MGSKGQSWIVLMLVLYFSHGNLKAQEFPFSNHTEVGVLMANGASNTPTSFTFQTFNGVRITPLMHVGFTTGIDVYAENTVLPMALGWRGVWEENKFSPMAGVDIGFGSAWLEKNTSTLSYKGGFLINPTIGMLMRTKGRGAISLTIGYKRQAFNRITTYRDTSSNTPPGSSALPPGVISRTQNQYNYNRMSLRLGLFF